MRNDVKNLAAVAKKVGYFLFTFNSILINKDKFDEVFCQYNPHILVVVDGVCSFGGEVFRIYFVN